MKDSTLGKIIGTAVAICLAATAFNLVGCASWTCSSPAFSESAHGAERRTVIACAGDEWVTSVRLGT